MIATGFEHKQVSPQAQIRKPGITDNEPVENRNNNLRPFGNQPSQDQLDIPTFLRNRSRPNND
ncbi:hypothetical protein D3C76_1801650 [compost metagenome]